MEERNLEKFSDLMNCPVRHVLDRFGDKWSVLILIMLDEKGTLRFNALHHTIPDISQKMLTVTLRTLEADGLITRKIYPEIPPRVEYQLTEMGSSLIPYIDGLAKWALHNMPHILRSRDQYNNKVTLN
ncbi:helix-turn-helix domain-containing protein [Cytophagaceae bacterium DM2B3-1]|uniref:Helix-turn-helix domain-containing protein n=1 Tax=Xanthocytophaga flava TaxID=3048013 RepID=A0AAE3U3R0_9BACT|nr:helix-turn-helix domain-containing protein [Xanthocytophaga flavus]MDJ1466308.1 helix-turn-helix domain-containing protein [Xanthocytophaga flavus]MDJ1478979.1 helix-turn-helix domain-containing protein [Xanthocytophaga flavus]MDJ1495513.1 helix-turn-helix domain-containing protein [Xanthocytophaga flavus]